MHHIGAERREHRFGFFKRRLVAAAENGERAVVGRLLPEHHGRVEQG